MLFSILIANYNNARYLRNCIDSALNQDIDKSEYEIVICDDCSTDNSIDVINTYGDRLTLYLNSINRGVGYTKKYLIDNSCGRYFLFLDADDFLRENCLNIFKAQLLEDFSLYYAQSDFLNVDGELINWTRSKRITNNLLEDTFLYPIFHPVLFSRRHYNMTYGMSTSLRCAEDFDLWYKMEEVGKIEFIDERLYVVRENTNSLTYTKQNINKWVSNLLFQYSAGVAALERRNIDTKFFNVQVSEILSSKIERFNRRKSKNNFIQKIMLRVFKR